MRCRSLTGNWYRSDSRNAERYSSSSDGHVGMCRTACSRSSDVWDSSLVVFGNPALTFSLTGIRLKAQPGGAP